MSFSWWFVLHLLYLLPGVLASLGTDYQALRSIKASFQDPQGKLQDWQGNATTVCSWTGVTCDKDRQFVTRLNLSSMAIAGNVAPEVGNLCNLTHLSLWGNRFTGPVPRLPCSASLQILELNDNNFTGGIPAEFGNYSHLVELNVEKNAMLGGPIPRELCNLVNLEVVSVAMAGVQGTIPDCLGQLTRLQQLDGTGNSLTGSIPAALSTLKNLELLDFSRNSLTGPIPPELARLSNLQVLRLWTNCLSGHLPPQLANLSRLTHFDVGTNKLEGPVPREYAELKYLQEFHILSNSLSGIFPAWLADLQHLTDISLTSNKFQGDIPQHLGMNSALESMDLGDNKFTGPIPLGLCNGGALSYLVLLDNLFTGPLPTGIQQCKSLRRLMVEQNKLTGSIDFSLPLLSYTTLGSNSFNGTLNLSSNMVYLEALDVSSNELKGKLPASLENLVRLQKLNLQSNFFSGGIPHLGSLLNLTNLYLGSNRLEGEIPSSLSSCKELTVFNASHNNLSGHISLTGLPKVSSIDLSHNNLTGGVPQSVSTTLLTLDVSYNNLSGVVPSALRSLQLNVAGNEHLCGSEIPGLRSCDSRYFPERHYHRHLVPLAIGTILAVLFIVLAVFTWKRLRTLQKLHQPLFWDIVSYQKPAVRLSEILDCVHRESNLITKSVYRTRLRDGREVAVKRLEGDDRQFLAEVAILGHLRHRNVVKLLASCSNGNCHLVVYEYKPRGNLRDYLEAHQDQVDWKIRLHIIKGIAQGLLYLHHSCQLQVVHRDVKCENILLDAELEPQLGDFGLAMKLSKGARSCTASRIAGTFGYIAPEYAYSLKAGVQSDVYSFGVVMLEMLTNKHARFEKDGLGLVEWVRSEPPELMEQGMEPTVYRLLIDVALGCTQELPSNRPTMHEVVARLSNVEAEMEATGVFRPLLVGLSQEEACPIARSLLTGESPSTIHLQGNATIHQSTDKS